MAPKTQKSKRLDPLKNRAEEQRAERREAAKKTQENEHNKRNLKDSEKLMKGNHRRTG